MLVPIPGAESLKFKDIFIERYSKLTDFEEFRKYSLSFLRRSVRVNTLKISVGKLKERLAESWGFEQIPWCNEGFWIKKKEAEAIGNTLEHALGYIYVQEAASMIPPLALFQNEQLEEPAVLDMCAAPGSKTTQLAQYMENKGVIIANDYTGARLAPLGINLQRCGVSNAITTLMHGQWFAKVKTRFDYILVDAPCSGTGTIRKSLKTIEDWNPKMVTKLSCVQKKLIETAFGILKKEGVMIYSTCSLEPEEDEGVVDFLIRKYDNAVVEKIILPDLKSSPTTTFFEDKKYSDKVADTLRIWPQDNDTEGFYIARIRKV